LCYKRFGAISHEVQHYLDFVHPISAERRSVTFGRPGGHDEAGRQLGPLHQVYKPGDAYDPPRFGNLAAYREKIAGYQAAYDKQLAEERARTQ
jgi:hypothetical protein